MRDRYKGLVKMNRKSAFAPPLLIYGLPISKSADVSAKYYNYKFFQHENITLSLTRSRGRRVVCAHINVDVITCIYGVYYKHTAYNNNNILFECTREITRTGVRFTLYDYART